MEFKGVAEKFSVSLVSDDGGSSQRVTCQARLGSRYALHSRYERDSPHAQPTCRATLPRSTDSALPSQVGLDGLFLLSPDNAQRTLRKFPLQHISRWALRGTRLVLYTRTPVDVEEQTVTLQADDRTICSVLDTLTCSCMQCVVSLPRPAPGAPPIVSSGACQVVPARDGVGMGGEWSSIMICRGFMTAPCWVNNDSLSCVHASTCIIRRVEMSSLRRSPSDRLGRGC